MSDPASINVVEISAEQYLTARCSGIWPSEHGAMTSAPSSRHLLTSPAVAYCQNSSSIHLSGSWAEGYRDFVMCSPRGRLSDGDRGCSASHSRAVRINHVATFPNSRSSREERFETVTRSAMHVLLLPGLQVVLRHTSSRPFVRTYVRHLDTTQLLCVP